MRPPVFRHTGVPVPDATEGGEFVSRRVIGEMKTVALVGALRGERAAYDAGSPGDDGDGHAAIPTVPNPTGRARMAGAWSTVRASAEKSLEKSPA